MGTGELLMVLAMVLLVFGPSKLPQFGDALGRGIRNFKKATSELGAEPVAAPVAVRARPALPTAATSGAAAAAVEAREAAPT
ncbi:MAG: twin-arginine translocase TatA/TatE family subunit [Anaeromyxobacteraceae bacterium]